VIENRAEIEKNKQTEEVGACVDKQPLFQSKETNKVARGGITIA